MEKASPKVPDPVPVPRDRELSSINKEELEEYKDCVLNAMLYNCLRLCSDHGRINHTTACTAIKLLSIELARMVEKKAIGRVIKDAEDEGMLNPDGQFGWKVAPRPERKHLW